MQTFYRIIKQERTRGNWPYDLMADVKAPKFLNNHETKYRLALFNRSQDYIIKRLNEETLKMKRLIKSKITDGVNIYTATFKVIGKIDEKEFTVKFISLKKDTNFIKK